MNRPLVTHVIGALNVGGAENVLYKLLSRVDRSRANHTLMSLVPGGPMRESFESLQLPLHFLGMHRGVPDPRALFRLVSHFRLVRPDVVVTWMHHSNLLGGLAAAFSGRIPVVWNVRDSGATHSQLKPLTRLACRVSRYAARLLPHTIVYVSRRSYVTHHPNFSPTCRARVIPNGFDTQVFRPNCEARKSLHSELALPPNTRLIGLIGRLHPDKDIPNFLSAAAMVNRAIPNVQFILCGEGAEPETVGLVRDLAHLGLSSNCHLLGRRRDMPRIMAGLDLLVSSSSAEAFPNVVGEAMSCAVPCVVTDVGDSAYLVGDTGRVVPRKDAACLADAIISLLSLPIQEFQSLGLSARERIQKHFNVESMLAEHEKLWLSAAGMSRNSTGPSLPNRKAA